MAKSYTKIQLHIVFAVKFRKALIAHSWEEELYKYITGAVQQRGHKMLAINGMPDHIHFAIGFKPTEDLSSMMREIKKSTTEFINSKFIRGNQFRWQEGYAAFSYAESDIQNVVNYILNQKEHHRKKTFREEYLKFLKEYDIEFEEKYLFEEPEE
jgi:REP element-mobilizing transposase RayT